MHLKTRNVNTAFRYFAEQFQCTELSNMRRTTSRNGTVLMIDEPVTVTYTHPRERVLFNSVRDANPFFHIFEALWMLAGRNDVASVAYYAKNMTQFSDDGKTLNGAYGYRWRQSKPVYPRVDQLDVLVQHLKAMPDSRRAVLQMWNVEDDLLKIGGMRETTTEANRGHRTYEPLPASKDVCCNLSVMFSLRLVDPEIYSEVGRPRPEGDVSREWKPAGYALDMTVTNRSNDLVWGMLGANYVHFSMLQEYMAARLNAEVGVYHHMTNNLHAYIERPDWKPQAWLAWSEENPEGCTRHGTGYYQHGVVKQIVPLIKDAATFEKELPEFVEKFSGKGNASVWGTNSQFNWKEPFLKDVAEPMMMAFQSYKEKGWNVEAMLIAEEWANQIKADDWRIAATEWLNRRVKT